MFQRLWISGSTTGLVYCTVISTVHGSDIAYAGEFPHIPHASHEISSVNLRALGRTVHLVALRELGQHDWRTQGQHTRRGNLKL